MDRVGVIGLGLMGGALAGRFLAGRLKVVGFDLRAECRQRLAERGGEPVTKLRGVFGTCPFVVLSLPNSQAVASVLEGSLDCLEGVTVIDTTTGDPDATAAIGRRFAEFDADYLDATLTGSSALAAAGELVVTAGGKPEAFARAEPLFRMIARRWFHVGEWGSGSRTKLVVNLVLGLNRAVLAEGLAFAKRCGLDAGIVLEILKSGAAYSRAMDAKGRKMIEGDFTPEAKLAQHLKDVKLILEAGEKTGANLPLSELHEALLSALVAEGLGDHDNSAVIRAFDPEGGP